MEAYHYEQVDVCLVIGNNNPGFFPVDIVHIFLDMMGCRSNPNHEMARYSYKKVESISDKSKPHQSSPFQNHSDYAQY